jgi:hypothetical protein
MIWIEWAEDIGQGRLTGGTLFQRGGSVVDGDDVPVVLAAFGGVDEKRKRMATSWD